MDMKMSGPSGTKAPTVAIADKRGKKTFLPFLLGSSRDESIARLKSTPDVTSRTAEYSNIIVQTIRQYPNEFKVEPKKDNAAGIAMAEVEKALFGADAGQRGGTPTDPVYKVVKSRYLAHYRKHGAAGTFTEKDGNLWIMPLKAVQVTAQEERSEIDPIEAFEKKVKAFTENGLTPQNARDFAEASEDAMALLGKFATRAHAIADGKVETLEEGEGEEGEPIFTIQRTK